MINTLVVLVFILNDFNQFIYYSNTFEVACTFYTQLIDSRFTLINAMIA